MTSMSGSAMVTVKADDELKDVLPAPPIAMRSFPQNDEIALFAEIYDNAASTPHKVDIITTIQTDDGRVLFKSEEERDSSELQGAKGGYGYVARVPLTDVAPGRLRAERAGEVAAGEGRRRRPSGAHPGDAAGPSRAAITGRASHRRTRSSRRVIGSDRRHSSTSRAMALRQKAGTPHGVRPFVICGRAIRSAVVVLLRGATSRAPWRRPVVLRDFELRHLRGLDRAVGVREVEVVAVHLRVVGRLNRDDLDLAGLEQAVDRTLAAGDDGAALVVPGFGRR